MGYFLGNTKDWNPKLRIKLSISVYNKLFTSTTKNKLHVNGVWPSKNSSVDKHTVDGNQQKSLVCVGFNLFELKWLTTS